VTVTEVSGGPGQPGTLDTSFNSTGQVLTDFSSLSGSVNSQGQAVAIQADGKIVAAGSSYPDFALARYNTDGSLDTSFNGTGRTVTAFPNAPNCCASAQALIIQGDGRIVAAGGSTYGGFALARYNTDGTLDTSFNGTGQVATGVNANLTSAAIQPDGKIVAVGYANGYFVVARYNTDGTLDTSFNGTGQELTAFPEIPTPYSGNNFAAGTAVAVQGDGRILAAGAVVVSGIYYSGLVRYNIGGTLDTSFNGTGHVLTTFPGSTATYSNAVTIQADGKIVAAGSSTVSGSDDFWSARYNTDGTIDTSFNGTGQIVTPFSCGLASSSARAVAIQGDGKIVAVGYSNLGNYQVALARYNTNGTLDASFNGTGQALTSFPGYTDNLAISEAIQADGKIVTAGYVFGNGLGQTFFALARYMAGPLSVAISSAGPTTFCSGGNVLLTATPSGGSGTYTGYQWYNGASPIGGATSATYSAATSGSYSVTVTDNTPTTSPNSAPVSITVNALLTAVASGTASICAGGSTGLTGSGGTSCSWSPSTGLNNPSSCSPSASPSATTTYTLSVTGANGCASANNPTVTVTVNPLPTATVSGTAAVCKGSSTTIRAALTGIGPWNLTWSDGFTQTAVATSPATRTVAPTATTAYTVTAVSDTKCAGTSSGSAVVTVEFPPKAAVSGGATICAGSSATIQAALTGIAPFILTWSDGFTQTVAASPATRTVSPAVTTTYSVTAVSDAACAGTASGSATIKVNPLPSAVITEAPSPICAGATGSASVPNGGVGATYNWFVSNGAIVSGAGTPKITFTAGASGSVNISVTVTSPAGCTSPPGSVSIPINPLPSSTITAPASICRNSSPPGGNKASVPDAGAGATYSWTIMNGSIVGPTNGTSVVFKPGSKTTVTLKVTVTSPNGCASSSSVTITVNQGC